VSAERQHPAPIGRQEDCTHVLDPDFASALEAAHFEVPADQAAQLEAYAKLLWQWNAQLNLTRHTTWELFVSRDLRDCLQLAPLLDADEEVLDLGSGNGIPGIPLSILRPDVDVSLAESVGKRANVLNEIVQQLDLPMPVYAARGEDLLQDFRFTTIVSRAVGSLEKFCRWMAPHWTHVGRLLLIKGPRWVEERGEARHTGALKGLQLRRAATYPLGDGGQEGVILQVWPDGSGKYQ
jgi:16S rRNA (guanine527-N7)-methyltransferase